MEAKLLKSMLLKLNISFVPAQPMYEDRCIYI